MTRLLLISYTHSTFLTETVAMVVHMAHACLSSHVKLVTTFLNFPQPPYLGNIPGGGGGGGGERLLSIWLWWGRAPLPRVVPGVIRGIARLLGGGHRVGHRVGCSSLQRERGENVICCFQVSKHKFIC